MKYAPLVTVGIVALGWVGVATLYSSSAQAAPIKLLPVYHAPYDPKAIDEEIAFHQLRVKNDPDGAIGWRMLSGAWLARSRESDMDTAAWKAEDAARKSLSLRRQGNADAQVKLAQSLLEQHRFQDALIEAQKVTDLHPENHEGPKLVVDCLLEIGRYREAEQALSKIPPNPQDYALMAIRARLASLTGRHDLALDLYKKARDISMDLPTVTEANLAWFDVRIGCELEAMGDFEGARQCFTQALKLYPNSYKATLGMARCAVSLDDTQGAKRWAKATLEIANSVDAKSILYAIAAEDEKQTIANEIRDQYRKEIAAFDKAGKGGSLHVRPIDRQFATFSAETGLFSKMALEAAKRDLSNRPDPIAKENLKRIEARLR